MGAALEFSLRYTLTGVTMEALVINAIEEAISRELAEESQVRYVLAENLGNGLQVWAIADSPGADVRRRIYEKELRLIKQFPNEVLDFNILQTLGRKPDEIASGARVVYSRPE
jgi:hypothetical protein